MNISNILLGQDDLGEEKVAFRFYEELNDYLPGGAGKGNLRSGLKGR